MKLHFVDNMDQVLAVALEGPLPQMPSEAETTMAPIATPPMWQASFIVSEQKANNEAV
jgi:hypothetical protein